MYYIIFAIFTIALISVYGRLAIHISLILFIASKKWLLFMVVSIKILLSRIELSLRSAIGSENTSVYEPLTPLAQVEDNKVYSDALNFALMHSDIKNVGLSGPYGSGKSTMMKTFQSLHPEYQYLNISLAAFNDEKTDDNLLEVSIIQQMFYHVRQADLPDSRFKRIKKMSEMGILIKVIIFTFWLGLSVVLLGKWPFAIPLDWKANSIGDSSDELLWLFLLLTIGMIHSIFRMYNGSKFNKVNISTGQLEISDSVDKTSILNKNLDEIIYFFDVTSFNVVLFEDLDRFTDTEIFTKLREINTIINCSRQIGRKIVFIYALREEVFGKGNKTKFFDFVVPIIPVVNSSNSGNVLLDRMRSVKLTSTTIEDMCSKLSFYISDMRLVKNIFNEFMMYKRKLGTFTLDLQKLLGMIVYKNTEAIDFAELNQNRGLVYEFLRERKKFLKIINEKSEEQIERLIKEVEAVKAWSLKNAQELRSVYGMKLFELTGFAKNGNLSIDGIRTQYDDLISEVGFEKFYSQGSIVYSAIGNVAQNTILFSTVENSVDESKSYRVRMDELDFQRNYKLEEGQKRIEALKMQVRESNKLRFSEIIAHPLIDVSTYEVSKNDTIMFLLREGYIDEDYHDFITYFHPGRITRKDKEFLLSITNHRAKPFDFEIENVQNLLAELRPRDFDQVEVLNYTVLDSLLAAGEKYSSEINAFCKHLPPGIEISKTFLEEYLLIGKFPGILVAKLAELHEGLWGFIRSDALYDLETKRKYLSFLVNYASISSLRLQDREGVLSSFISSQNDFLLLIDKNMGIDKFKSILSGLSLKFANLDNHGSKEYFEAVIDTGSYEPNSDMIAKAIKFTSPDKSIHKKLDSDLKKRNYTTILMHGNENVIAHVQRNFEEYFKLVLLAEKDNDSESEEAFIEALNRMSGFGDDNIYEFIKKTNVAVNDLSKVNSDMQEPLLVFNKVIANWPNVYEFNTKHQLSQTLIDYLNRGENYKKLKAMNIRESLDAIEDLQVTLMMNYIAELNALGYDAYRGLLDSFDEKLDGIEFSPLHESKVKVLIEKQKLSYNLKNFEILQQKFKGLNISLAENDPDHFMEDLDNYTLNIAEFFRLFKSTKFSFSHKEQVLQHVTPDDIKASYDLTNIIIDVFIKVHQDLSEDMLDAIAKSQVEFEKKAKFLFDYFLQYDENGIRELLKSIGGSYSKLVYDNEDNVKISLSDFNTRLLNLLKDEGVIVDFKIAGREYSVNLL